MAGVDDTQIGRWLEQIMQRESARVDDSRIL